MSEQIFAADDYLGFWQSICSRTENLDLSQTYFHHAEQFLDGHRTYSRDRILARLQQIFAAAGPNRVLASCESCIENNTQLFSCALALDSGETLIAMAEAAKGRIKREWVQLKGAPPVAPAGLNPGLPEMDELCGCHQYPLPDSARQLLQSLQQTYAESRSRRLLVKHCAASPGQVILLWHLLEKNRQYKNWQGLSLYLLQKEEMHLAAVSSQVPDMAMPSAIRS